MADIPVFTALPGPIRMNKRLGISKPHVFKKYASGKSLK